MSTADLLDTIRCADIFDLCAQVDDASVDMILCDLPYGTTACSWDTVIPFEPMWAAFKRIIKPRGAIVLTASQPFTSALVMSNVGMFKYSWVWEKQKPTGVLYVEHRPLKAHEDIVVFSSGNPPYYAQGLMAIKPINNGRKDKKGAIHDGGVPNPHYLQTIGNYPRSVLKVSVEPDRIHPTQKPVALFRYLIRTYTQPGELVFDPCCGSGTTALAAREELRHYICCDSDAGYAAVAQKRLDAPYTLPLFAAE